MRQSEIKMSPNALNVKASDLVDVTVGLEFELIVKDFGHDKYANFVSEPIWNYNRTVFSASWKNLSSDLVAFFTDYRYDSPERPKIIETVKSVKKDYYSFKRKLWAKYIKENFDIFVKEFDPDNKNDKKINLLHFKTKNYVYFTNTVVELHRWLTTNNLITMRQWHEKFNLVWPYMTTIHSYDRYMGKGSRDLNVISKSFSDVVGMPVEFDVQYHGSDRSSSVYNIEPDRSLIPDNKSKDYGLEFVSPPMSIDDMVNQIHKVKTWAKTNGNAYTNKSCGLHINVSIPGYDLKQLDYVKLAVFLGDNWVSEQFGRLDHEYCRSAINKIKSLTKDKHNTEKVISYMKQSLLLTASKLLHDGRTDKYMTIHTHKNRVEFRAPGGNWLDMDINIIINIMKRCVVALSIALDPEKYKQEYAIKLYKLISSNKDDKLNIFAQYNNGLISIEKFKLLWALEKLNCNPNSNEKTLSLATVISNHRYYNLFNYSTGKFVYKFKASSRDEAAKIAKEYAKLHKIESCDVQFVPIT